MTTAPTPSSTTTTSSSSSPYSSIRRFGNGSGNGGTFHHRRSSPGALMTTKTTAQQQQQQQKPSSSSVVGSTSTSSSSSSSLSTTLSSSIIKRRSLNLHLNRPHSRSRQQQQQPGGVQQQKQQQQQKSSELTTTSLSLSSSTSQHVAPPPRQQFTFDRVYPPPSSDNNNGNSSYKPIRSAVSSTTTRGTIMSMNQQQQQQQQFRPGGGAPSSMNSPGTPSSNKSEENYDLSGTSNRVWVQVSAIDAAKSNKSMGGGGAGGGSRQFGGIIGSPALPSSTMSSRSAGGNHHHHSHGMRGGGGGGGGPSSFLPSVADTESVTDSSSGSGARARKAWGWRCGTMVDSSSGYVIVRLYGSNGVSNNNAGAGGGENEDIFLSNSGHEDEEELVPITIKLPSNALTNGDVVLANEYEMSPKNKNSGGGSVPGGGGGGESGCDIISLPQPPADLITLTHLHEPAVVEALQHRYQQDLIYTSTGPVLLALNPFQTLRGMYGESIQKRYWDKAERNLTSELPPHVYSIADAAFRNMMRALEDSRGCRMSSDGDDDERRTPTAAAAASPGTPTSVLTTGTNNTVADSKCNQSILVSGESGAGKTVTTKFVMKYLAALSQRSAALAKQEQRAYLKASSVTTAGSNNEKSPLPSPRRMSPSKTRTFQQHGSAPQPQSHFGGSSFVTPTKNNNTSTSTTTKSAPSWMGRAAKSSANNSANRGNATSDLSAASLLAGVNSNSIEAQVLQSNPILESFGNARTVRNDNSSRFGKFIEIQFTAYGQLVGAHLDTYLLEKVRLVHQSHGERNYHVFLELLSGAVDPAQLRQWYLQPTATPQDFRITSSGTYDRRDGVSDCDTYEQLLTALRTMQFNATEIKDIFGVVATILHASNLDFNELVGEEESSLDAKNVHIQPVCDLLGVTPADLNEALCSFYIQAGKDNFVKRSLSRAKAQRGLEALLKETYGALFTYLVQRINDSMAFEEEVSDEKRHEDDDSDCTNNDDDDDVDDDDGFASAVMIQSAESSSSPRRKKKHRPAASIGVLDIFGFESFTRNSFEQFCINYCNEALQQQFNAFVLKNEQAVYEKEGIEWSFIEFPENQDVLDLIEKRGSGILSILDDQCRAPGPSDKAFCLNVYSKCGSLARFSASRKQTATLQFAVHHYAGPVEYSAEGFTEKNRDELPKETTELLKNSENPFIKRLAAIIDSYQEEALTALDGTPMPKRLHRADSSVGRATVGGQFRRQLRHLRHKIDLTAPHYIRCLKPNDLLVPDHFDPGVVAEQLRCGGILEAVRVARAGYTQHYPHADFYRRYRALAWRELGKKSSSDSSGNSSVGWNNHTTSRRLGNSPRGTPRTNHISHRRNVHLTVKTPQTMKPPKPAAEVKADCRELLKVLYKKITLQNKGDERESGLVSLEAPSPVAKAKTYSHGRSTGTPAAPWIKAQQQEEVSEASAETTTTSIRSASVRSRQSLASAENHIYSRTPEAPTSPTATWKRGGITAVDYAKVGIQLGKTKVFLRHKAFEALERIRSREQTRAATKIGSIFRRYLARIAYLPYRNAFRQEMHERRRLFEDSDFKESKVEDYIDDDCTVCTSPTSQRLRNLSAFSGKFSPASLVDKWMESQIRDAIHNPIPRNEWGKQAPSRHSFKWVLSEGIWVKNFAHKDVDSGG